MGFCMEQSTWAISGGRDRTPGAPLNVPPVLASNFYLTSERVYARSEGTATVDALQELLGGLDGGRALAFSSGMAAAAAVLNRLPVGATLVLPLDPYHGVSGLADEAEEQGRWNVVRLDQADTAAWVAAALTADLLWLESPANPLMTVADLPAICGAPRKAGTLVAVDSTFATPMCQQPLALGADVVMHSATKFLGGHSDLLAGALVVASDTLYDELHHRRLLHGGSIGAMEAFLTIRGIRTFPLRMERAQANAAELARRLEGHPAISAVRYPGLESDPNHVRAASFMTGFGAMISFDVAAGGDSASAVCDKTQLVNHATSLGGVETTMERRSVIPGQETIPAGLIRLSVGCEDIEDLWADMAQALAD
jgi:cystathionine gamma-synthase